MDDYSIEDNINTNNNSKNIISTDTLDSIDNDTNESVDVLDSSEVLSTEDMDKAEITASVQIIDIAYKRIQEYIQTKGLIMLDADTAAVNFYYLFKHSTNN